MSAVTNQPLPFGRLEREKHIEMIFRAFQNRCGPSCDCNTQSSRPTPHETSPHQDSDELPSGLAPGRKTLNSNIQQMGGLKTSGPEEPRGTDNLSVLDTISQIHITARPELQGPQCVPRRIYNITSEGTDLPLFVAVEESSCVCLQCCGPARACSLQGFNCKGRQVFYLERPLRMDACCFGCCLMEMRVYTPQKHLIGSICQRWSMFTPLLEVCDSNGVSAIRIQGSCCPCRCLSNQQFQIVSNIGENIGTIWKRWPGFNEEHNMDHEYFGLDVPPSMESHTKLLLLAATFLLSHMFFEMS
ncbi:phospholipid scramblase 2 [Sphaeramia orbicularis]|uniref:phospholipid scramblase 2 n=1 Tax=Sphaeramia orbicularis TaxID=375764 RepID=UPI00117E9606|nr:phospholipid scramblase 2-like [Sphaeramia orbicularis]XP_030016191.1 phospholipid scramblase 2-like [Sphaeramia orbicularis]